LKYVAAVVSAKRAEADVINERIERRSTLLANILSVPINGGLPLIRQLFAGSKKKRT
jgi:hypothetical protein